MLSVTAEAEPKTLVGLGRPLDAGRALDFLDESLPDSGVRTFDEPDDEDGFSDNEADTRVELFPPALDTPDAIDPPGGPESSDWVDAPESSPLPEVSDLAEPYRESELLPASWEDGDEEATRPQLFLPNYPSEPPPSLPGSRVADSDPAAAQPPSGQSHPRVEAPVDRSAGVEREHPGSAHAAPLPSSPFSAASEAFLPAQGLNPRLSGMLAGAGMGAATAIALVALFAWRSSGHGGTALPPAPALPPTGVVPSEAVVTSEQPKQELPSDDAPVAAAPSGSLGAAPAPHPRGTPRSASTAVAALPVKLEEEEAGVAGPRGMLRVSSLPAAHVVLDGRPVGMTPKLVPVSAGEHTVLFVHPELGRRTLRVSVEDDGKAEAFTRF